MLIKSIVLLSLAAISTATHPDPDCGKMRKCYLVNLDKSGKEVYTTDGVELKKGETTVYDPKSANDWSIRCVTGDGTINYVKYSLSGERVETHYSTPYWMGGDNSGKRVNRYEPLKKCGVKDLKVVFHSWRGGDKYPCDTVSFQLKASCAAPPTMAPPPPPTKAAPTKPPPTMAPPPPPTKAAPTKPPPTMAPPPPPTVAPHPPATKECYLLGNSLYYGTRINKDFKIEVNFGAHNAQWLTFTPGSGKSISVNKYKFNGHPYGFFLRFYNPAGDVAGHWKWCKNKSPTGNHIVSLKAIPANCYLWGSRLGYGAYVPKGTKVEVVTADQKKFAFYTTHTNQNYLTDHSARGKFDRRNFSMRFVYANGLKTPYTKCRNFTPIGIDLDRSGAVERITANGTDHFQIDITGDGNVNYLKEWFAPTEGILINSKLDIVNGTITGQHLYGDMGRTYADGFEKLLLHDANKDGHISGAELEGLAVWVDGDSNNILDEGELSTLESHGIVSLSTFHTDLVSSATLKDGGVIRLEDILFKR